MSSKPALTAYEAHPHLSPGTRVWCASKGVGVVIPGDPMYPTFMRVRLDHQLHPATVFPHELRLYPEACLVAHEDTAGLITVAQMAAAHPAHPTAWAAQRLTLTPEQAAVLAARLLHLVANPPDAE